MFSLEGALIHAVTDLTTALQVIEEFMSLADGQLVLEAASDSQPPQPSTPEHQLGSSQDTVSPSQQTITGSNVDVSASVSRIGARAHPPALATLAPSIR